MSQTGEGDQGVATLTQCQPGVLLLISVELLIMTVLARQ